jgi:archaellum component FlaF (FlaF/FlaG flagellin family)
VDKVITSMLLIIAAIVATVVVINAVLPSIQRTSSDIAAASDVVGARLRSDVRIVETAGVVGNDYLQVWAKNVGASNIPSLEKIDVFFGETTDFERIGYDPEDTCPNPSPPPRTENCWQYALENDTEWTPYATLRITIYLTYNLETGKDYVSTIVLPNGLIASKIFSL